MAKISRNRFLLTLAVVLVVVPAVVCGGLIVIDERLSASAYLSRLADIPTRPLTIEVICERLLERIPVGTPHAAIYTILEAYGMVQDQFVGGQWMRYQQPHGDHTILVLLSEPPYSWTLFYTQVGFVMRFQLDDTDGLQDITLESTAHCTYS